ncbi:MAG: hypothetical protein ABRQ24_11715 [Syntrophomonadaceae bacterium]
MDNHLDTEQQEALDLLGIFADLGKRDARLEEAVAIVREKQRTDGKWKLENSFNGKMLVTIEKKGRPSEWITYKAQKVLKALG